MKLELDFEKSVEENASKYFEQSKKAKRKLVGLEKAIEETKKKLAKQQKTQVEKPVLEKKKKKEWFESFRWFYSSDGFLVVSGRSAKSNEQIVKKYLDKEDFFLHADISGGAVTIIKTAGKRIPEKTFQEAAQFAAVFSRAWKNSLATIDVYAVEASQVSKSAPTGTSLAAGSFMISGKRKYLKKTPLKLAIGLAKSNNQLLVGPFSAIKTKVAKPLELRQGSGTAANTAKEILEILKAHSKNLVQVSVDEIVSAIPGENVELKKE
ncbi:MAG: hypothetical protein CL943_01145 [Candidatus Diapherotrites archaeon]|uniref:NFACT RNA-binding domain-containing protein n=1 Tax=Candidatus Iainarchaeum sp. TaxID=3101447 RepID=A0A2D6M0F1_9ARCH|nr:hypothetical protein [Candidatus Diapherotrites archaeon]|tara:strand:- start:5126 stop:5923 length:798 start_codon:yes stop_codon:yes gene_type:complete